jgi:hypothetical protein
LKEIETRIKSTHPRVRFDPPKIKLQVSPAFSTSPFTAAVVTARGDKLILWHAFTAKSLMKFLLTHNA